jgi:anti-sigma regulatory factor (Ser/Thr protein kinase)
MARHVLTLRAETSQITVMNDWLRAAFAGEAVARRVAEDMKLCLNEAVANVILHGAAGRPEARIEIELTVEGGARRRAAERRLPGLRPAGRAGGGPDHRARRRAGRGLRDRPDARDGRGARLPAGGGAQRADDRLRCRRLSARLSR